MPRSRKRFAKQDAQIERKMDSGSGDESSSSEVGLATPEVSGEDNIRTLLESQNRHFSELIKVVQRSQVTANDTMAVVLPKFNPDRDGADPRSWSETVDYILSENPLEGSALVMTLSKSLQGSASHWLSQTCFAGITWKQFRELFLQHFAGTETVAATVMNLLTGRPKEGECMSLYGSRMVTSLMSRWKSLSVEQIAVSVALAHTAGIDKRLRRLVFTTEVKTRIEMHQELKAFSFDTKPSQNSNDDSSGPPGKRPKLFPHIKCHKCGKPGHKKVDCRSNRETTLQQKPANQHSAYTGGKDRSTLTCYNCGKPGHVSTVCPERRAPNKSNIVKDVNMCTVLEPLGTLLQFGESFQFCFDSGAECSLVKETASLRLSGSRISNVVVLRGIGNNTVCSTLQILANVMMCEHSLEILFHVVLDNYIKYDVMIGREILSQGIGVTITSNSLTMFNEKSIMPVLVTECDPDLANVDTDLLGSDKDQLLSILREFSKSFITGIPQSRVTTGQLEIRLIDENKTVQRRPYRLSVEEKGQVRCIVQQLLDSNIIRPSSSPFASPMLLVRKKNGSDRLCVDYRELNANTVSDKYPLPLISDQIARLSGAKFFTCIDMASGFHQIPVHPNSIERTAFVTPEGQFEYLAMPFGLKNAPAVFQRAINNALGDLTHSFVIVYMDDVMVVAPTKEEAFDRLQLVLRTLSKAGFSFNVTKCSFLKSCVEYDEDSSPEPESI